MYIKNIYLWSFAMQAKRETKLVVGEKFELEIRFFFFFTMVEIPGYFSFDGMGK